MLNLCAWDSCWVDAWVADRWWLLRFLRRKFFLDLFGWARILEVIDLTADTLIEFGWRRPLFRWEKRGGRPTYADYGLAACVLLGDPPVIVNGIFFYNTTQWALRITYLDSRRQQCCLFCCSLMTSLQRRTSLDELVQFPHYAERRMN